MGIAGYLFLMLFIPAKYVKSFAKYWDKSPVFCDIIQELIREST
jgi:hypothetical protein